jgi:hypothetical protein
MAVDPDTSAENNQGVPQAKVVAVDPDTAAENNQGVPQAKVMAVDPDTAAENNQGVPQAKVVAVDPDTAAENNQGVPQAKVMAVDPDTAAEKDQHRWRLRRRRNQRSHGHRRHRICGQLRAGMQPESPIWRMRVKESTTERSGSDRVSPIGSSTDETTKVTG